MVSFILMKRDYVYIFENKTLVISFVISVDLGSNVTGWLCSQFLSSTEGRSRITTEKCHVFCLLLCASVSVSFSL